MANSEAYALEDNEGWGPSTGSEEGELVDEERSSNKSLSNIRELHQADIEVREEIPPSRFLLPMKLVELEAPRDEELKN